MIMKKDSGVAVVVAFVLILAVIAVAIGVWALFGLPDEIHAAEEEYVIEAANAYTDYRIQLEALQNTNLTGMNVSYLFPLGSAASSGSLALEPAGVLGVTYSDAGTDTTKLYALQRLVSTLGTTGTSVGFEGFGVFRNDNNNAYWSVPLNMSLGNDAAGNVSLQMNAATFGGTVNLGGTGGLPLNTYYRGDNVTASLAAGTNKTVNIMYLADSAWDASMWHTQFLEVERAYDTMFPAGAPNTSVEVSRTGLVVWMNITSTNGNGWYTFDVHVPEYNVRVGEAYVVALAWHTIEVKAVNAGGSIIYNGHDVTNTSVRVREGNDAVFTISPAYGSKIKSVKVNGTKLDPVTREYTFKNVMDNKQKIEVEFEPAKTYTITASAGEGGSITPDVDVVVEGESVIFTVTSNSGYHIKSVIATPEGGSASTLSYPYTITNVQQNYTVVASFEEKVPDTYVIHATADSGGLISPSGEQVVTKGDTIEFTITPNTGYEIESVLVDGVSQGAVPAYTFTNVIDDHTISATFKEKGWIQVEYGPSFIGILWWYIQVSSADSVTVGDISVIEPSKQFNGAGYHSWLALQRDTITVNIKYTKDGVSDEVTIDNIPLRETKKIYV